MLLCVKYELDSSNTFETKTWFLDDTVTWKKLADKSRSVKANWRCSMLSHDLDNTTNTYFWQSVVLPANNLLEAQNEVMKRFSFPYLGLKRTFDTSRPLPSEEVNMFVWFLFLRWLSYIK